MKPKWLGLLLLSGFRAIGAVADPVEELPDHVKNVYGLVESKVVQLLVTGVYDGHDVPSQTGVGCVFQTSTGIRIMTAKHVVGEDKKFDQDPDRITLRRRDITMTVVTPFGADPGIGHAHAIREHSTMDVAEIIPEGADQLNDGLRVSLAPIKTNDVVIVVTWPIDKHRPVAREVRVLPREGDDGTLVRLDRQYFEGDSGSPVFNGQGALIAVTLVEATSARSGASTFALPLSEFRDWLMPVVEADSAVRKERERLAKMFDEVIVKMREAQQADDETIFPAFRKYEESQSQEAWNAVVYAVRQSLEPIEQGIRLSREYDAQVAPLSQEVSLELENVKSYEINRTYSRKFTEVREVLNGGAPEMLTISRQELGPSREDAEKWEKDLRERYARLAELLSAISNELTASTSH